MSVVHLFSREDSRGWVETVCGYWFEPPVNVTGDIKEITCKECAKQLVDMDWNGDIHLSKETVAYLEALLATRS